MPTKTSSSSAAATLRTKLSELNSRLQHAQAVAEADRRKADSAKADAKRARKIYKLAKKAAKVSKKETKALRREIKAMIAKGEELAAAAKSKKPIGPKRLRKTAAKRPEPEAVATPEAPSQPEIVPSVLPADGAV